MVGGGTPVKTLKQTGSIGDTNGKNGKAAKRGEVLKSVMQVGPREMLKNVKPTGPGIGTHCKIEKQVWGHGKNVKQTGPKTVRIIKR